MHCQAHERRREKSKEEQRRAKKKEGEGGGSLFVSFEEKVLNPIRQKDLHISNAFNLFQ